MISDGYFDNRQSCPRYPHRRCWRCPFPVPISPPIHHHLTFTTLQIDGFTLVPWGNDIHFAKPVSWWAIKGNLSSLQITARSVGFSPQFSPQPVLVSVNAHAWWPLCFPSSIQETGLSLNLKMLLSNLINTEIQVREVKCLHGVQVTQLEKNTVAIWAKFPAQTKSKWNRET